MSSTGAHLGPIGTVTCVAGETVCISGRSGQIQRGSEQGLYVRDTRALNHLLVRLDHAEPLVLAGHAVGGGAGRFTAYWPDHPAAADPRVLLDRRRVVSEGPFESFRLHNFGTSPLELIFGLEFDADFASVFDVKHGRNTEAARCEVYEAGLRFVRGGRATIVRPLRSPDELHARDGVLAWQVQLAPREDWVVEVEIGFVEQAEQWWPASSRRDVGAASHGPAAPWRALEIACSHPGLPALVDRSVDDLASLLIEDREGPGDWFFAAGSPWYLTLFGRDSLWSAYMSLPLGLEVARGTLRALARRQGRAHDPETEEAPGKIIHEVRHGTLGGRGVLPPRYYGTMDATPLFVTLVHEAWRWGLDENEVAALLPAVEAALGWLATDADADGDGFLEYRRSAKRGLEHQGWKDSPDGVQFADGRIAEPPIALCEVQGYAYDAAMRGAELLDRFHRPGGAGWRGWAEGLAQRFRSTFWIDGADGLYPAVALDGAKRRVDGIASNMGHLPGTGILDEAECAHVATRLTRPDLAGGWGLRTLSSTSPRFNPLSYHCGSVWPHDTAIAVAGLAAAGCGEGAALLLRQLLDAAPYFSMRLPELFAGEQRHPGLDPLPYPAACQPQAWSAGAVLLLLRAALGLQPDVPAGRVLLRPLWPPPFTRLEVRRLVVGGGELGVIVDAELGVHVTGAPPGIEVTVEHAPTT